MQASMHSMILSLYASYYDIDHGFCRCYEECKDNEKNTIFNEPKENLIFMLGLGYRGEEPYPGKCDRRDTKSEKPKPEQIYQWM
jgi:nitroreductase